VDAPLAAQLELEVAHRIGHVDRLARHAQLLQGAVEQLAGRSDEGPAAQVFLLARLLADAHHRRLERPFAGHGLRGRRADGAFAATLQPLVEARQSPGIQQRCRRLGQRGMRCAATVAGCSIMTPLRSCACAASGAISCASGRLRQ
jgi:hypothetical protein